MSHAWEVTDEDIASAMHELGLKGSVELWRTHVNPDEVESTVLAYTDFDEQCSAAHNEIVSQLNGFAKVV